LHHRKRGSLSPDDTRRELELRDREVVIGIVHRHSGGGAAPAATNAVRNTRCDILPVRFMGLDGYFTIVRSKGATVFMAERQTRREGPHFVDPDLINVQCDP